MLQKIVVRAGWGHLSATQGRKATSLGKTKQPESEDSVSSALSEFSHASPYQMIEPSLFPLVPSLQLKAEAPIYAVTANDMMRAVFVFQQLQFYGCQKGDSQDTLRALETVYAHLELGNCISQLFYPFITLSRKTSSQHLYTPQLSRNVRSFYMQSQIHHLSQWGIRSVKGIYLPCIIL